MELLLLSICRRRAFYMRRAARQVPRADMESAPYVLFNAWHLPLPAYTQPSRPSFSGAKPLARVVRAGAVYKAMPPFSTAGGSCTGRCQCIVFGVFADQCAARPAGRRSAAPPCGPCRRGGQPATAPRPAITAINADFSFLGHGSLSNSSSSVRPSYPATAAQEYAVRAAARPARESSRRRYGRSARRRTLARGGQCAGPGSGVAITAPPWASPKNIVSVGRASMCRADPASGQRPPAQRRGGCRWRRPQPDPRRAPSTCSGVRPPEQPRPLQRFPVGHQDAPQPARKSGTAGAGQRKQIATAAGVRGGSAGRGDFRKRVYAQNGFVCDLPAAPGTPPPGSAVTACATGSMPLGP